jgi:hypothetical protein
MASSGTTFISSFINIGSGVQKLLGEGIHMLIHTRRLQGDLIILTFLIRKAG